MIAKKCFRLFLSATLMMVVAPILSPVRASDEAAKKATASPGKFAGSWSGKIAGQLELIVKIQPEKEHPELLTGSFDVPAQNVSGFELGNIEAKGDAISFKLKGVPGDARFEGKLSGDGKSIAGTFHQGPSKIDLTLAMVPNSVEKQMTKPALAAPEGPDGNAKPAKTAEAKEAPASPLAGTWRGKVGGQLEIIFKFAPPAKDGEKWSGTFDVPVQNVKDFSLEKIEIADKSLKFGLGGVPGDARYEGTIAEDGKSAKGRYRQGPVDVELELTKDAVKASKIDAKTIDDIANKMLADWKAPGLALAVVKDGQIVHAAGYGFKDVDQKLPMTADTLLAIGSCTKAFTTATIASLVEQGLLDWDRPVHQYWPDFRIVDPATTQFVTLRDMVSHRTGLPRHDLMWFAGELPRAEILKRVEFLQPAAPIRQKWIYNNIMFVTAAAAAERATGKSWEELVRTTILDPLAMKRTNFHIAEMTADPDHAVGYHDKGKSKDGFKVKPYREIAGMAPAGSINSSAREMAAWMNLHLGHTTKASDGKEILRKSTIAELHNPVMIAGGNVAQNERKDVHDLGYALGWGAESDRGRRVVKHGGAIDGFVALVSLWPDDDLGIVALVNQSGSALPGIVSRTVADKILGNAEVDWSALALARVAAAEAATATAKADKAKARIADTKPSHPTKDYVGTYENPAFGKLVVTSEGDVLKLAYGVIKFPLKHWHYDVFAADGLKPEDDAFEGKLFRFVTETDGTIGSVSSDFEMMIPPAVFKRIADDRTSDPAFLDTLAGEYELATQVLRIERTGSTLQAVLPGQPIYRLKPSKELTFEFDGLTGFRIRFETDAEGKATGIAVEQPNGTFAGKKKTK
ncbi:serine hydrolase [bacterium]|nr:serine hydrolase [bacterium]